MSDSTVEERLAKLEEAIQGIRNLIDNHILHTIRSLDTRVWALLVLGFAAVLGAWLR